jgi:hypothetical protein
VSQPLAAAGSSAGGGLPSIPEAVPAAAVQANSTPPAAAAAAGTCPADEWEEEDEEDEEEEEETPQHGPFTPITLQRHEQRQRQRAALQQLQQDIWQKPGGQQQQQLDELQQQQLQQDGQQQQWHSSAQLVVPDSDVTMTDADEDFHTPVGATGPTAGNCGANAASRGVHFSNTVFSSSAAAAETEHTPTAAAYGAVAGHATPGTTGLSQRRYSLEAAAAAAAPAGQLQQPQTNGIASQHIQQQEQQMQQPDQKQQQPIQPQQLFAAPANGKLLQPADNQQQQQQQQRHSLPAPPAATANGNSNGPPGAAAAAAAPTGLLQIKEKPCKWIYVLDTYQRLFVHAKYKGKFHHSSFLQGGAVLSAGGIVVENGRIVKLTADSGHYRWVVVWGSQIVCGFGRWVCQGLRLSKVGRMLHSAHSSEAGRFAANTLLAVLLCAELQLAVLCRIQLCY